MTSETFAVDRRYLVLQYSVASIAYLQQVLGMKDFFEPKQIAQFHTILLGNDVKSRS